MKRLSKAKKSLPVVNEILNEQRESLQQQRNQNERSIILPQADGIIENDK